MINSAELFLAAQAGDNDACEKLIQKNAALVCSIVKRFLGRNVDYDDLYQLGCLGLLKAIRSFDVSLGNQFSTYAVPKISGEIRRFLRDDGSVKVSRTLKERSIKIRRAAEELRVNLGREPTLSEISKVVNLAPEEITEAECALMQTDSLNREINESGQTLGEMLDCSLTTEDTTLEYISLSDSISTLPTQERLVIMLRFFRCLTQQQVAGILKISQVQVSRVEKRAINNLKSKLTGL
ncbi:MAG: sigma-70 family RNA polymerase sigma factor [Oscillospiraceae bacterium]|nr:sigma-70 family RNA polymerase sigma factor [Oscillospiraceae bacterium]